MSDDQIVGAVDGVDGDVGHRGRLGLVGTDGQGMDGMPAFLGDLRHGVVAAGVVDSIGDQNHLSVGAAGMGEHEIQAAGDVGRLPVGRQRADLRWVFDLAALGGEREIPRHEMLVDSRQLRTQRLPDRLQPAGAVGNVGKTHRPRNVDEEQQRPLRLGTIDAAQNRLEKHQRRQRQCDDADTQQQAGAFGAQFGPKIDVKSDRQKRENGERPDHPQQGKMQAGEEDDDQRPRDGDGGERQTDPPAGSSPNPPRHRVDRQNRRPDSADRHPPVKSALPKYFQRTNHSTRLFFFTPQQAL